MSIGKLYPTALALSLFLAACLDDPLGVTESDLPLIDEQMEATVVQAAPDDGVVTEPSRHRFAVDVSVDGALVPHASVTLIVKGVATQELTGGNVRLLLPTMAAMEHAGTDKRPSYPVGSEFPAIKSWVLSGMDAGETWEQSVKITLPEKGYYHAAVRVTVTAPDGKDSPFVFDDTSNDAWLLVMDGGGLVTHFFDASVLPQGFEPGEGPFRETPRGRGATATYDGSYSDSDDDIEIHLVYYEKGQRKNAKDAELKLLYKRHSNNSVVSTHWRTVPSNGKVSIPCPPTGQYVKGSGIVPATKHVVAGTGLVDFYTGRDDCGETEQISARHSVYIPWRNLNKVIPLIEDHFDQDRKRISWNLNFSKNAARYYPSSDRITFGSSDYKNEWVAAHEFGHGFHHKALGGLWTTHNCSPHYIDKPSSYTCAFSEGFADYAANVGTGNPSYWEYKHYTKSGYDEAEIEGNIAALLHDLIDSNQDSSDHTNYGADYIADVFETCRADGKKRNDVTDFVWCLENRINAGSHNSGFPRGPDAPSRVSEGASEPSDWNADDIRAVWWKNVT